MKKIYWGIMLVVLFITGCGKEEAPKVVESKKVVTAPVETREIQDVSSADSVAIPKNKVNHVIDTSGTVQKLYKKNGERVNKGDLIITLKDSTVEAEFRSAKASLEASKSSVIAAENNYQKFQRLYNKQLVSEMEYLVYKTKFTDAQGDYLNKKARYEDAKDNYDKLNRVASIDGILGNLFVKEGNEVVKGDMLFTVIDETEMELSSDFPGKWFSTLKVGGDALVYVSDLDGKEFKGYIKEINPIADPSTKKYKVKIGVPNIDGMIKDGMYAKSIIPAGKRTTLTVPQKSVVVRSLLSYVYLVQEGQAKRLEIATGTVQEPFIEILTDKVKAGDKVIVDGTFGLADGEKVEEVQAK